MYKILGADEREYGPVDPEQLKVWIFEGRVNAQTLAVKEGSEEWKPLSAYPELAEVLANASAPSQGAPPPVGDTVSGSPAPSIPNYLVPAILCTLCCCLPFGVVAIIYAAQVNTKLDAGDYDAAEAASDNARMWCWIAFAAGALGTIVYLLILGNSGLY